MVRVELGAKIVLSYCSRQVHLRKVKNLTNSDLWDLLALFYVPPLQRDEKTCQYLRFEAPVPVQIGSFTNT